MAKSANNGKSGIGTEIGSDGNAPSGEDKFKPIIVDPSDIDDASAGSGSGGSDSGDAPRKRGRPKGSGNSSVGGKTGRPKKAETLDVDGLSAIFLSSHGMLAALTKTQELAIDKNEAEALASGVANVARHYDIGGASQKTLDWFNLIQALALVYGTRIFALRGKIKPKAKKQEAPTPENSSQMNGAGGITLDQFGNVLQ